MGRDDGPQFQRDRFRWEKVCQQICNRQTTHTVSDEAAKSKGVTEEDKKSMSLSVTAGITPPPTGGPSGGVTWTGGMEQSIARTMNESISRGEIYADTNNYTYTPEQMQQLNIFAIWRFVADTTWTLWRGRNHSGRARIDEHPLHRQRADQRQDDHHFHQRVYLHVGREPTNVSAW